ncbi:hypothetical protein FPQ18DRAFT_326964 [Pyronema domesticum]|nr:hypothetical protein FPQ18DRAFT_326964 [Pyronema domesticum]
MPTASSASSASLAPDAPIPVPQNIILTIRVIGVVAVIDILIIIPNRRRVFQPVLEAHTVVGPAVSIILLLGVQILLGVDNSKAAFDTVDELADDQFLDLFGTHCDDLICSGIRMSVLDGTCTIANSTGLLCKSMSGYATTTIHPDTVADAAVFVVLVDEDMAWVVGLVGARIVGIVIRHSGVIRGWCSVDVRIIKVIAKLVPLNLRGQGRGKAVIGSNVLVRGTSCYFV